MKSNTRNGSISGSIKNFYSILTKEFEIPKLVIDPSWNEWDIEEKDFEDLGPSFKSIFNKQKLLKEKKSKKKTVDPKTYIMQTEM